MNRIARLSLQVLTLVVLLSASFTPAMAASTIVAVSPAAGAVNVGETLVVNVTVADVTALFGAEFHLTFDAGKLEVVDADPATDGVQIALGSFLSNDVAQNTASNTAGTVDFGVSQMSPHGPRAAAVLSLRSRSRARRTAQPHSPSAASCWPIPVARRSGQPSEWRSDGLRWLNNASPNDGRSNHDRHSHSDHDSADWLHRAGVPCRTRWRDTLLDWSGVRHAAQQDRLLQRHREREPDLRRDQTGHPSRTVVSDSGWSCRSEAVHPWRHSANSGSCHSYSGAGLPVLPHCGAG